MAQQTTSQETIETGDETIPADENEGTNTTTTASNATEVEAQGETDNTSLGVANVLEVQGATAVATGTGGMTETPGVE